jgi:uncharacterized protein
MGDDYLTKLDRLKSILRDTGGCAIGFSGGVDSTLLVTVAREVLGDRCLAVIATSSTYARDEREQAVQWVRNRGIPYLVIESEELDIPQFRENPPDRCYHCKKELFGKIRLAAAEHGLNCIADGTNADDVHDYRPGLRAAEELKVLSPLKEAGLTKDEIRAISREVYHLPTADKPAMACLASRFPYGSTITQQKLRQVEAVERYLREKGFVGCRARHHGNVLRLELRANDIPRLVDGGIGAGLIQFAKKQGFTYVTLDLEGYRTGSMNEVLDERSV